MGFLDKFKKQPEAEHYVALDIGTEFVKALIFRVEENTEGNGERGVVVGTGRQRQKLGDMNGGAVTDISGVVDNCLVALERAEDMAGVSPTKVVVGIAGELVKGTTTTVRYERLRPKTQIDLPELKNIVKKIQQKAFDHARKQLAWETGYQELDVKLVNASITGVKIDGYKVTNPIGFQGKDVTVGIFNAFAPMVHLGALQTIADDLGLDLISVAAEPYAVAKSVGIDESQEFSAIFIDIGGGTSDIAVVRNGGVEGTKMFAIGGRSYTKRLAQVLNVSFAEAEKVKIAYSKGGLVKKSEDVVRKALISDAKVWLSGVELSLSEFSDVDLLPSRIMLCGGGSHLPEIKEVLENEDWYKNLPFAKKPSIKFIKPKDIHTIIDTTDTLKDQQDVTPMGLANLVIGMDEDENVIHGILSKVAKTFSV